MAAMAPPSSSSSLPARLPSKPLTPLHPSLLRQKAPPAAASAPRPLLLSFPTPAAPARRRGAGVRAPAAQQRSAEYQFEDEEDDEEEEEEEEYDGEEEEWEEDEDEEEEMDVEAMEEEARGAAAGLAKRLARELHIDDDVREKRRNIRDKTSVSKHIPDSLLPKVAIIGRPNVGKSALFNRLVGGNRAIVVDEPGVTRDRLYGRSYWGEQEFMVIDTGGVITLSKSQAGVMEELAVTTTVGMDGIPLATREAAIARMPSMIEKQAVAAVDEADVILFVVDGQAGLGSSFFFCEVFAGLVAADIEIADWLRRNYSDKCVILAVNKCESPRKGQMQALDFWSLGFSPLPISAITGTGTGDLLDLVCSELKKFEGLDGVEEEKSKIPAIAIVGRPNVGKSSLLNALVGEDRTIVSPVSGTTRDAIDTEFTTADGEKYKLIDTAGIRRRAAVVSAGSTTESLSVKRAFRAIRRSDVVALVIEAMACVTEQDYKIAERIEKEGKACVIVVNKWDTIPNKNHESTTHYEQDVRGKLRILDWAPVVYCSATNGTSVEKIISAAALVEKERSRRLGTSILNQVVREAIAFKPPPRTRGGKRGRVYYTTQAAVGPPTFVLFVNDAKLFPDTYRRYMEKKLRSDAGFPGTPIRLLWRSRRRPDKRGKSADSKLQSPGTPSKIVVAA
ncbi:GTPase Der [Dichanthelium oligosanthes]|uniref:GTPase Der n=1 Tax=Dichanthelium oligosanthes TaxID=888268 RepID=A0A1E5VHR5_9POAL|nr:GTPase Der [Dichanthelium oligosanthes]